MEEEGYKIINPLKMDKKKYLVLLYDIAFWLSFIVISAVYGFFELKLFKSKYAVLDFASILQGYGINQAYNSLLSLYIYTIIFTIIYFLVISLVRSYFRIKYLSLLFNKKISTKLFWKYYFGNLIFLPILIVIIYYLLSRYIQPDYYSGDFTVKGIYWSIILVILFSHYAFFNTLNFVRTKKVFLSIKKGLKDSIKIKYFGLPYLFMILVLFLISLIVLKFPIFVLISIPGFFVVLLWTREYMKVCYEE